MAGTVNRRSGEIRVSPAARNEIWKRYVRDYARLSLAADKAAAVEAIRLENKMEVWQYDSQRGF